MFYNTSMVAMLQENGRMRRIMSERKRSEERVVLVRKSHRRKKEKRGKFMDAEKIKTMTEKNKNYMPNRNRYASMRYRRAGTSGLKIPEVSLGLWHNFGSVDCFENMRDMIFTAFDAGVTLFDIANNYGPVPWSAEKNFGRILKNDLAAYRDEMVITTKAGYYGWDGPYGDDGSRKYLIASLDRSLKNIGVDYVDVFYHHCPASETPLEETCMAHKRIIDSGKALYIGISNYFSEDMEAAVKILSEYRIPIILDQVRYSMFDRRVEKDGLLAAAKQEGVGLTIFSPLEQGILTDRYLNGIPEDSRAGKGSFLKRSAITEDTLKKVRALKEIAEERGQTLSQMALSWVMKEDVVSSVIIGASRSEQIEENLKLNTSFAKEELAAIDRICVGEKTDE